MLDTLAAKIVNVAEEFIRLYADQIRGEIDPEDVRKLTPEQQERLKIIMELSRNFGAMDELAQVTMLKHSVKSMIAINKMKEIPAKVDAMFKGTATLDEVERLILQIPDDRFLETNDTESIKIYTEYCKSIYMFMLYANFIGRDKKLFQKEEIQSIVSAIAEKEAHEIYGEPNLPPELRDAALMTKGQMIPHGLRQAIIEADNSREKYKYINSNLLQELYAYKAEIVTIDVSEKAAEKLKEVGIIQERIIGYKNRARKKLAAAILYTTMTAAFVAWPCYNFLRVLGKAKENKLYKPSITMDGQPETTEYAAGSLEFVSWDDAREAFNSKSKSMRTVTEFNTMAGNRVEVKVYDYTDSDISDEELNTAKLDESNLVYHSTFDMSSEEIKSSVEHFAGEFTGSSSRNVSRITFNMSDFDSISFNIVSKYLSLMLGCSLYRLFNPEKIKCYHTGLIPLDMIIETIDNFDAALSAKRWQKEAIKKEDEASSELETLERQAELGKLQEARLKAIADRNRVDNELLGFAVKPIMK